MSKMVWVDPPKGEDGFSLRDESGNLPEGTGWQPAPERVTTATHGISMGFETVLCPVTGEKIRTEKQMNELARNTGKRLNSKEELIQLGQQEVARRRNPNPTPTNRERREMRDRINDSIERASSSGFSRRALYE